MDYYAAARAFLVAAETLSLSKAALQLEVKVSTISRHISQLEADMGIALFNRSTRGLVLTEGGQVFREHVTGALKVLEEARRATSSLNTRPRGNLRLTVPTSFGRQHIVRHLPEFMRKFPDVSLDIQFENETVNLIEKEIDLAVRIGVLLPSQLMARKLGHHYRIACASHSYLNQAGVPSSPGELAEHKVIRFSLANDDRWFFTKEVQPAQQHPSDVEMTFNGSIRIDDTDSLRELAIADCGIAFLPYWAAREAIQSGKLRHVLQGWRIHASKGEQAIWAVYPRKKTVSSKVRAFIDFYAEVFQIEGE